MKFYKKNKQIIVTLSLVLFFLYAFSLIIILGKDKKHTQQYEKIQNETNFASLANDSKPQNLKQINNTANLTDLVEQIEFKVSDKIGNSSVVLGAAEIVFQDDSEINCENLMGIVIDAPLGSGEKCNEQDCTIRYIEASVLAMTPPHRTDELYPQTFTEEEKNKDYVIDDPVIATTPCKVRIDCKICQTSCIWDLSSWQHIYTREQAFTYPGYENVKDNDEYWTEVESETKRRASNSGENVGKCESNSGIQEPQLFCAEGELREGSEGIKIAEIFAPNILFAGSEVGPDNTLLINNHKDVHSRRNSAEMINPEYEYLANMPPSDERREFVKSLKNTSKEPFKMHYAVDGIVGDTVFDNDESSLCPESLNDGSFNVELSNRLQKEMTGRFTPPHKLDTVLSDRNTSARICREGVRTINYTEEESKPLCAEGFWDNLGCKIIELFR